MEKVKISGIKLSNELVLVNLPGNDLLHSPLDYLCRLMARNKININFLFSRQTEQGVSVCYTAAVEEEPVIKQALLDQPILAEKVEIVKSVGLISIYPSHFNLEILGTALTAFGEKKLKIYGLASSLSTLTFVCDYFKLDMAVSALKDYFTFPSYHTPYRPEIMVKQSGIARDDQ